MGQPLRMVYKQLHDCVVGNGAGWGRVKMPSRLVVQARGRHSIQ